jgi:hypothetical protein
MDSLKGFYTEADRARALAHRSAEASESRARATALRRDNFLVTSALTTLLPFRWEPGVVKPRYQGPPVWERGPAAIHVRLLEPAQLGSTQRPAGDWLCKASLDTDTGEVRYESQQAPWHSDGTGGPGANYLPAPTCKNCLKKAQAFATPAQ